MRATIAMATNRAAIIPPMMPATGEPERYSREISHAAFKGEFLMTLIHNT